MFIYELFQIKIHKNTKQIEFIGKIFLPKLLFDCFNKHSNEFNNSWITVFCWLCIIEICKLSDIYLLYQQLQTFWSSYDMDFWWIGIWTINNWYWKFEMDYWDNVSKYKLLGILWRINKTILREIKTSSNQIMIHMIIQNKKLRKDENKLIMNKSQFWWIKNYLRFNLKRKIAFLNG